MKAVSQLMVYGPYAAGDSFTLADMYTFYSMGAASSISKKMFDLELLEDYPEISDLLMLAERPSIARAQRPSGHCCCAANLPISEKGLLFLLQEILDDKFTISFDKHS